MSRVTGSQNCPLFAGAAAAALTTFLALAPPLQASPLAPLPLAPACDQFVFNGRFVVYGTTQDIGRSGWDVFFTSTGRSAGTPPAAVTFWDGGQVKGHVIGGGIEGRSINFQIKWDDKPDNVWRFLGTIGDDGFATGLEDGPGSGASWQSRTALACATPAPTQQPAPAQKTLATATSDLDIYNIAHDDVDTGDGVVGTKMGTLGSGQQVELAGSCQPNAWCKIVLPDQADRFGFVLGHLQF